MYFSPFYLLSSIAGVSLILLLTKRPKSNNNEFIDLNKTSPEKKNLVEAEPKTDIIFLYIAFSRPVHGNELLHYIMSNQLQYGDQKVFYYGNEANPIFSIATLTPPGTFNLKDVPQQYFNGLTFFMETKHVPEDLENFDLMLETLLEAKDQFGGTIKSRNKKELTESDLQIWREHINEATDL